MYWYHFCHEVIKKGALSTEYVYVEKAQKMLGEHDRRGKFPQLSESEVSIICNSNGSRFTLRDDNYQLLELNDGIFFYDCGLRVLAYGKISDYILIVITRLSADKSRLLNCCKHAITHGLGAIKDRET
ncbi:unnamed protein product [Clavelina lepadiformis]|uniref:Profilin n=1 Tax=Clavelina lepadiformis TaxID=159417 RepID=A0ABP0GJF0_CLALP